jgi:hypothetical protein
MPGPQKKTSPLVEMTAMERREHPRTHKYGTQQLTIIRDRDGKQDKIVGALWDFSEGGVGMDLPRALIIDEVVGMEGDLRSPDFAMTITAKARVAYCRPVDRENYRVGFGFIEISYRRLETKPN